MLNHKNNNIIKSDKKILLSSLMKNFFNRSVLISIEKSSLEQETLLGRFMNEFYLISLSKDKITSISNVLCQTFKQKYTPSLSSLICQRNELLKYKANRRKQKPTKIVPYNHTINTSYNSFRDFNSTNKKHSFKVGIFHSRNLNTALKGILQAIIGNKSIIQQIISIHLIKLQNV